MALTDSSIVISPGRYLSVSQWMHVQIQRGRGPDPLKNQKNVGFLSSTGSDPLINHKATKLGQHRHAREMPFKWRFAGGPMLARL